MNLRSLFNRMQTLISGKLCVSLVIDHIRDMKRQIVVRILMSMTHSSIAFCANCLFRGWDLFVRDSWWSQYITSFLGFLKRTVERNNLSYYKGAKSFKTHVSQTYTVRGGVKLILTPRAPPIKTIATPYLCMLVGYKLHARPSIVSSRGKMRQFYYFF